MSFIRTKDGIYEVVGFDNECIIPSKLVKVKTNGRERITHCCDTDIIKQADTIEELCDEFVQMYINIPSINPIVLTYDEDVEETKRQFLDKNHKPKFNIYGAIWTDKGLIYVAKLNDKGEMELL